MSQQPSGRHALVVGASVAGLLAGWVLARHFEAVTVVERDGLPAMPAARRGVPQGRHAHVLLQGGIDAFEELFAGTAFDLDAAGTVRLDGARDLRWYQFGVWKNRFESGLAARWCDRVRLELHLRRHVAGLGNLRFLPGHRVTDLIGVEGGSRVVGVRTGDGGELRADLVVDATGRGSRTPEWLEGLGYPRCAEETVAVDIGYACRVYRRPPHLRVDWTALVIYPTPPATRRTGILYPLDGERWLAALSGWCGDHPPGDEPGFLAFARALPVGELHALIEGAEPLSAIHRHRFKANRWRRYERMARWPDGFAVVGDAVCSFNPIYGQGMTVSARDALALDRALTRLRRRGLDVVRAAGFARGLQRKLARGRAIPWQLATASDFRFPEVEGRRPPGLGLMNWYTGVVLELSAESAEVHRHFLEVVGLRKPPATLFRPAVAARVLRRALAGPSKRPAPVGAAEAPPAPAAPDRTSGPSNAA